MVTRARKSSKASKRRKQEAEGKLSHFALSSPAELRPDWLKRDCSQSTFKLFPWWCIDIAGRKLMLVTLGTKRVKPSIVSNILFAVDCMICSCTSTLASDVCKETLSSLFWAPKESIIGSAFLFSLTLIGKSIRSFLTGQSWHVLKSWYTGVYPEQGFSHCFAMGLNQSLVSSVVQSTLQSP